MLSHRRKYIIAPLTSRNLILQFDISSDPASRCHPITRPMSQMDQTLPIHLTPVQINVRCCEGFRMPAYDGRHRERRGWGPAFENLQGRKSREGIRRRCGALYGDLAAARGVADGSRWG